MRLGWLTDIHLNPVTPVQVAQLADQIRGNAAARELIGGDICEAPSFARYVTEPAELTALPIDFVLGNDDYRRSEPYDLSGKQVIDP